MAAPLRRNSRSDEVKAAGAKLELCESTRAEKQRSEMEIGDEELRIRRVYEERSQTIPAERYSSQNQGNIFIRQELERHLLSALHRFACGPLSAQKILDVGCGAGFWLRKFIKWGATPKNVFGIDLMGDQVAEAGQRLPIGTTLRVESATKMSFADESFDLLLQFTVFSSVLHFPTRIKMAREMSRVLKPGGHIVWYDFFVNNPWNPNVRGVGRREIRALFPGYRGSFRRITVAPPLIRRMGSLVPAVYPILASLTICFTHYLAILEK
jgi:ubiquinone/menaquinone biosynthesis C-methylase UbiE